jgi:alanyl-tRNA synthetase
MQNIRGDGPGKEGYPILGELPAKNIDTGLGLERTAALLQGVENIYEIDTTAMILNRASQLSGVSYGAAQSSDISLRVIADHARTAAMLIGDGVVPGNEGRGYILRRMMRRTIRNMKLLGSEDRTIKELMISSIEAMAPQYPELNADRERITKVAEGEEEAFLSTLRSGTQIFDMAAAGAKSQGAKTISGDEVFKLHDTYGFPYDLTLEMAREEGLEIDGDGFRRLMKEQRERAKADAKAKKSGHTDLSEYRKIADISGATQFIGYSNLKSEAKLQGILLDGKSSKSAQVGNEVEIILDRTPFYAEGGGQLADGGLITTESGAQIEIDDVQSPIPGLYVHRGRVADGEIAIGENVMALIDQERRAGISRAHTATHMVHKAFREILGETATQAGSENAPGRFRFDFPSPGAVPQSVLADVEARVNSLLIDDLEVTAAEMSIADAKAMGAMALFGEKYGERVRVVSVGDWAKELCGGTHVARSGQLGVIKLLSESSIGAGVRRVEALVGSDAYSFLAREHLLINSLTDLIKGARSEELPERISELIGRLKDMEREFKALKLDQLRAQIPDLLLGVEQINKYRVLLKHFSESIGADELRTLSLEIRERNKGSIVVLSSVVDGRIVLVATVDEVARTSGMKAGELAKLASVELGGGGGGKDDFAQGGGPKSAAIANAFDLIRKRIAT